jgi:hypothetical protein
MAIEVLDESHPTLVATLMDEKWATDARHPASLGGGIGSHQVTFSETVLLDEDTWRLVAGLVTR